ncbi:MULTISPECIES: RagB/SusD family nutrient uptake outer membrane protein [Niastella]|uniref:RagB/SusD family nutrient uptake outer membrane protein n=1 Tax=Niastella soli TaxID=2821487 RepID=A0ABS3YYK6_9BACT|nr:RagB/SusD family nutrient uptake outer membrane protein [Niastella soli]MBO9202968.1 RagB/SusD family nutrient uptake outer membrane protein [Niastella soli]
MKNFILFTIVVLTLSSCKKWLDVSPVSQVSAEELFKTAEGFEEALSGVYTSCTNMNLYGFELTGGLPDVLAQNYTMTSGYDFLHYEKSAVYNYNDRYFVAKKDTIWSGLYNGIANCNLLLENIEKRGGVLTADRRQLIKGEALALRGYLHFDLLRLFAPSYKSNPGASLIPYVTSFSNKVTKTSTVTEVLTNIVNDLTQAKELLRTVDPIMSGYKVGYNTDVPSTEESSQSLFLQNRRHRMNYYAVCGELARVNLYLEKKTDALNNAMEVINSNVFPWTAAADFQNSKLDQKDRILYKELLFAWYAPNMKDTLSTRFNVDLKGLVTEKNTGSLLYEVKGAGADDRRFKEWYKEVSGASSFDWYLLQKYQRDPDNNRHYLVMPALRLSEMYYIAAECTYETNPTKGVELLQAVRAARGITKALTVASQEEMFQELVKEARKEFFGEGQIFYMYKRLNRSIVNFAGGNVPPSDKVFVWPLPVNETEFGNH